MGMILPVDILSDVSYCLIDDVVNTQLNPAGGAVGPGMVMVTPGSMAGIFPSVQLAIGSGNTREAAVIVTTTATTFTVNLVNQHAPSDQVIGATFPAGQPDHPLYVQEEILQYVFEAQQDFLLRVRLVYTIGEQGLNVGNRVYQSPADAVRIERVSIDGVELFDVTQTDLDWADSAWQSDTTNPNPIYWYQDKVGPENFGVGPQPQVGSTARLFYSQKNGGLSLGLLTPFVVPDVFTYLLKYGALAKCFSKDGEQRDLERSKYCQGRFTMGCMIAAKFMKGVSARMRDEEETVEPLLAAVGGR